MGVFDFLKKKENRTAGRKATSAKPISSEKKAEVKAAKTISQTKYHWQTDVIREPLLTEKTNRLAKQQVVTFKVEPKANRTQIKEAIQKIFNVKVAEVQTEQVKRRSRGRLKIRAVRKPFKKAYITLKPGSKIALFE